MAARDDALEGGMLVLYHGGRPVGIVRGTRDKYEGAPIMNIGPLALIPEYQGRGLGRMLLRAALSFAVEQGYAQAILCVNAENERAKGLYLQEGFSQVEAAANYRYDLGN
nr:GNAT family N-acetyltransferase [Fontibacillus phaseoli]